SATSTIRRASGWSSWHAGDREAPGTLRPVVFTGGLCPPFPATLCRGTALHPGAEVARTGTDYRSHRVRRRGGDEHDPAHHGRQLPAAAAALRAECAHYGDQSPHTPDRRGAQSRPRKPRHWHHLMLSSAEKRCKSAV